MNLSGIDLNLLLLFDALMTERSVTRAARRTGLSQPAMSHALRRLRTLLDDPVLVRAGDAMEPTRRALELAEPIRAALSQLRVALDPHPRFEPATSRHSFTIATADYVEFVMLPSLNERLAREAPGVDLVIRPMMALPVEELRSGSVDLAIGVFADTPTGIERRRLFDERLVSLVRHDHPTVGRRLSLQRFAALGHVLVAPMGRPGSVVDPLLAEKGLHRRVAVTTPHFLIAPVLVARSDLIVTLAERVARTYAEQLPLKILRPPLEIPGFTISMGWHARRSAEPEHRWLRAVLADLAHAL